jgi:hypothetical protein
MMILIFILIRECVVAVSNKWTNNIFPGETIIHWERRSGIPLWWRWAKCWAAGWWWSNVTTLVVTGWPVPWCVLPRSRRKAVRSRVWGCCWATLERAALYPCQKFGGTSRNSSTPTGCSEVLLTSHFWQLYATTGGSVWCSSGRHRCAGASTTEDITSGCRAGLCHLSSARQDVLPRELTCIPWLRNRVQRPVRRDAHLQHFPLWRVVLWAGTLQGLVSLTMESVVPMLGIGAVCLLL